MWRGSEWEGIETDRAMGIIREGVGNGRQGNKYKSEGEVKG